MLPRAETAAELMSRLLDRGYERAAAAVLDALTSQMTRGLMRTRLQQLQTEAQRLQAAGLAMEADNPVLRAFLADFEQAARAGGALIDGAAESMRQAGITAANDITVQLSAGMSPAQLAQVGIRWNMPSPEALQRIVDLVDSDAFAQEIARYGRGLVEVVRNTAIRGIVSGLNPLAIAEQVTLAAQNIPQSYANQILRSLQLSAYRAATTATYVANADILEPYAIRIAVLDSRTCMGCVARHGERIPLGAGVSDHRNGRCTSVAPLRGRTLSIRSGVDWFASLPEARQRAQMGTAAYNAWRAGALELSQLAGRTTDPLFGEVVTQASLRGILGDAARQYYSWRASR